MTEFQNCAGWTLINKYTIHEKAADSERPNVWACVPKFLEVEVTNFELVHRLVAEWDDPSKYTDDSFISFSGQLLRDKISIFSVEFGEIAVFDSLVNSRISFSLSDRIGGKNKASPLDGTEYVGLFPEKLMPPKD